MKFWGTFRFELGYQLRRPWPWLAFAALVIFAFFNTRVGILPVTLPQDFILNSPFIIAAVSVTGCMIWLLVASMIAGDAAARDVQTGMHPLAYTVPVSKLDYLGGRFLAAFVLNALVLVGVQVGSLLAVYAPGIAPEIVGPFRPAAYLAAYALIALPNAMIATTIQFAAALASGRSLAGYVGSVVLVFFTVPVPLVLYVGLGMQRLALMMDPIGLMSIMNEMMLKWTVVEKNVRMFTLEGPMLWNRLLWLGIMAVTLAVMFARFRFAHRTAISINPFDWLRALRGRSSAAASPAPAHREHERITATVPPVQQSFGFAVHVRQMLSIAASSLRGIAMSLPGLFLLVVFPAFVVLVLVVESEHWSIPLLPKTGLILAKHLTAPLTQAADFRVAIPLLIIYFAGELIWRERDAGMSENVDATSVPEWVLFLGKYLGLAGLLAVYMMSLTGAGVVAQTIMGYHDYELGRYLTLLFGLQLPEYLLFAALAFLVHAVVNHKYVGMLVGLVAYFLIIFSSVLGIHHKLIVYGSSPSWTLTDMRGFAGTVGPWAWFKLYWAAWALGLGVMARVFWPRGREPGFGTRLRVARQRLTRHTVGVAALAVGLVVTLGGFIFYNTNVLNEYITDDELVELRADYERLYGKYEGIPQPARVATKLHIEIYPDQRAATIRGSYRLVNRDTVPIDSVHLEPAPGLGTRMTFDRPAHPVVTDDRHGHYIYALEQPLQPGDSLTLEFDLRLERRGFRNSGLGPNGAGRGIFENGTYFTNGGLPLIGYQPARELWSASDRRKYGLPRQLTLAGLSDIDPNMTVGPGATFEAVIGTAPDQVAVAPGELRREWTEGPATSSGQGRRYFHYASDVPIHGTDVFFSASYTVHREHYNGVDLQVYVHPQHATHLERLLRGIRASLDYNWAQFGSYPYRFLQVVEQPGNFFGMGVDGSGVITGGEGFFMVNPQVDGSKNFDVIFEVVAHEVGHQWWGMQLRPAWAEGGGVISEGLAWYSTMQVVKKEKGREALRRLMSFMREPNPWPEIRTGYPLLRAMDPWANYRKAPYVMHALSEYVGEANVNGALRRLVEKKRTTLATTLDMYHELQAVTPDSLKPLLRDFFETNTFWTFDTKRAEAVQTEAGTWEVMFEVEAHKVVADSAGKETELPVNEWVEMGIFAAAEPGEFLGKPLYVQKHRIRSGKQTITIVLPEKPARGGIDPYNLLDWAEGDNIEPIEAKGSRE